MPGVHPYIASKGNCREAIEFYKGALGAKVTLEQTFGDSPMSNMGSAENIMHRSLQVGSFTIMMCDDPRPGEGAVGGNISLAIGLNDPAKAKELFDALAEGGSAIMPLTKTFWAEAFGMLTDKFGIKWMVNGEAPK